MGFIILYILIRFSLVIKYYFKNQTDRLQQKFCKKKIRFLKYLFKRL